MWFNLHRGLDHFISFLLNFLIPDLDFCILGALMGFRSFIESFIVKVFHEDLETISNFLMFVDPSAVFAMLSLCYA